MSTTADRNNILIIGPNGYLGHAVGRAFVRAGHNAYGIIRSPKHANLLAQDEITPIVGSFDDPDKLATEVFSHASPIHVAVITVEDLANYVPLLTSILAVLRKISERSLAAHGVKPLVLHTSGTKDYGETGLASDAHTSPITEASPYNGPSALQARVHSAERVFAHADAFDAALVRPVNLYGRSGSAWAHFFRLAQKAKADGAPLVLKAHPQTLLPTLHVDDCADAFVALADARVRERVRGQRFVVGGAQPEILEEVAAALVAEFGIAGGVEYAPQRVKGEEGEGLDYYMVSFSQRVSSEKIRRVTGWSERRPRFAEGVRVYRRAFEAAVALGAAGC